MGQSYDSEELLKRKKRLVPKETASSTEILTCSPRTLLSEHTEASLYLCPTELLVSICHYLNVDDFRAFSHTCRKYRYINDNLISMDYYRVLLNSHEYPHHLLLAESRAKRLNDWAAESLSHQIQLHDAIERGMEGLAELAVRTFPLTFVDIQGIARWDRETLAYMTRMVKGTDSQLKHWVVRRRTVEPRGECHMLNHHEIEVALLNFQIFQQLFSTRIQKQFNQVLEQDPNVQYVDDNHTRSCLTRNGGRITEAIEVDFAQYCLPDTRSRYPNFILQGECHLTNMWRVMWRLGLIILHFLEREPQEPKTYVLRLVAEAAATQDLDSIKSYWDEEATAESTARKRIACCCDLVAGMNWRTNMVGQVDISDFMSITTCLNKSFSKVDVLEG
ncbi:MAG: hypothetical protein M1836_005538 [Candelina mexicana]|nr:MAG: hypothetical protein M1836_005538 [Candelina mexicana]